MPNYIAGITVGHNIQEDRPIEINSWNDIILVDRKYFLEHKQEIGVWASSVKA